MFTASRLAAAAAVLTPVLGIAYLSRAEFVASRCFSRPTFDGSGTLTGCENIHADLPGMFALAPYELLVPLGTVLAASVLAGAGWRATRVPVADPIRVAAVAAIYAVALLPISLFIGPVFVAPLLLLVSTTLLVSGATPPVVVRELIKATIVVVGAFSATLVGIALWRARFGAFPSGGFEWLYVGVATALGIAAGCLAAATARDPREALRYLVLSYGGFGAAAVGTLVVLIPVFYPEGRYVNLGIAGFWRTASTLVLANAVAGIVTFRYGAGLPWWHAIGATCAAGLGFALAFVALRALPGPS